MVFVVKSPLSDVKQRRIQQLPVRPEPRRPGRRGRGGRAQPHGTGRAKHRGAGLCRWAQLEMVQGGAPPVINQLEDPFPLRIGDFQGLC